MISEQISFFVTALQQHDYPISVGRRPSPSSLNVVIENFSPPNRDVLLEFCRSSRKRVAMIMTEHLDFEQGRIFFHGVPLGTESDYILAETAIGRVTRVLECLPHLRCVFVLGDLPELRNMTRMLPGLDIRSIPFPRIHSVVTQDGACAQETTCDLVFTGGLTRYRSQILAELGNAGFSLVYPKTYLSRRGRNAINRAGKMVLNIPQREGWRWLSLMRILAGLQTGRPTISLGTSDGSRIASSCTQLDITKQDWVGELRQLLGHWKSLYLRDMGSYEVMVETYERERGFPHDVFDFWSVTDGLIA